MKRTLATWSGVVAILSAASAGAFDTQTHAYITYQAFLNSNLGNPSAPALLQQIGLDRFDPPQPFSPYWLTAPFPESFYFDNAPSGAPLQYERPVTAYEWLQMQQLALTGRLGANSSSVVGPTPIQTLPIGNWLMRGAIREDDLTPSYYSPLDGPAPDPDPYGDIRRSLNHFYNPIQNKPLTLAASLGQKSVDWALGTVDAFSSLAPDSGRRQHFSWEDARNNTWLALVAERDANSDGMRSAAERKADAEERLFRWATTFRALGNIVHLLEDAAQPQHTRNDRHDAHVNPDDQQGFEPFTNERLIGEGAVTGADPTGGQTYVYGLVHDNNKMFQQFLTPVLDINGYPVPAFTTPLRFFTTRAASDTDTTPPDGRLGMADYSNKGFFTRGTTPDANTLLPGVFPFPKPDPTLTGFTPQTTNCAFLPKLRSQPITCTTYFHTVPDPVAPTRPDATTAEPLLADGMWKGFLSSTNQYTLTPQVYQTTGDLVIPRAIAYSAGIINYFFRGKLAVTSPPDKVVGVLNQGAVHTMNAQGYPCVGTATNDGCPIFGFQSIRVSVQNTTAKITETGTGTQVPQNLSDTAAGSVTDANFHGPYLVAVAKYHRNTCYKPDLSGERAQGYAPIPQINITEPTCAAGQTVRTAYQEISVSKSAAVTGAVLNAASASEVHFDFSADPIPVNATDLFIQVVYRGPMGDATLGQEPDAIAVGTYDVREPTFTAFWNNTDYYWDESNWLAHTPTYPNDSAQDFWACAGGFPVKYVFLYNGAPGAPAMGDPISLSNAPGVVRLGFLFPPPDPGQPSQRKVVRGTPVAYALPGEPAIPLRSPSTTGTFRQANVENLAAGVLTTPTQNCGSGLPGTAQYWCFDTIQKRRGQRFGEPAQPMYLEPLAGGVTPTDVDAVPLPAFAGETVLTSGTIRFDTDTTLLACPAQPASMAQPVDADHLRLIELQEEAASLGISPE